jgi:glycolate oxidase iron-sulfur subunit
VPWHRRVPSRNTNPGAAGLKVAFYVGCLIDKVFLQVGDAVLTILEHHGVGVYLPPNQGCCGIPALSSGDTRTFDTLVRHNLELFNSNPFDYLVTACATCTSTIKKMWPLMALGYSEAEKAQISALANKTLDISQFLVEKVGLEQGSSQDVTDKVPLTYHDPCHLKKSLGVAAQPRALIQANPRYDLQEMAEPDWCCGCGGSFNLQYYETSAAIGRRKRDNIVRSQCAVVATGCPACMLQLTDMFSQAGSKIKVKHTAEIYEESLKERR